MTTWTAAPDAGRRQGLWRAALWPTVLTAPALLLLVGLGAWQLDRLEWKTALIADRAARLAADPVPLPARIDDPAAFEFRRVTVAGRFLHGRELHLVATSRAGDAGYHVVTPLERADGGGLVLIDRGWVPPGRKAPESRAAGQVAGTVRIDGVARASGRQGAFTPDNDPVGNTWYWRDLAGMAAHLGDPVAPLLIEAGAAANPGGLPLGGQTRVVLRNNHLGYAITWYGLAAALVTVYAVFVAGRRREARS